MQWLLNVQNQKSCIHVADIHVITSFSFRWRSVRIICLCNEYPIKLKLYSKTEVCRGIHIVFLSLVQNIDCGAA